MIMFEKEKFYIAVLNSISRIGSETVKKLVGYFGNAENVWRADIQELQQAGLNPLLIDNFTAFRSKFPDAVTKLADFCHAKKINICTYYNEEYPPILKEINSAPVAFYYHGLLIPNAKRIAMVGTRDATPYGEKVTKNLAEELATTGLTVVSGAAKGIDTFAHNAALKSGRTVAVLGFGLNKIPTDKHKLFEEIIDNGGVVMTEFPPNFEGNNRTFPARNRIIAGLSRGVIIVETNEKSGTLITADYAKKFSRKVFVVPHNIFSEKGVGCNSLISGGATLITCAQDVLDYYR